MKHNSMKTDIMRAITNNSKHRKISMYWSKRDSYSLRPFVCVLFAIFLWKNSLWS